MEMKVIEGEKRTPEKRTSEKDGKKGSGKKEMDLKQQYIEKGPKIKINKG